MTKRELEDMNIDELIELAEEYDEFWTIDSLKDFAKYAIDANNFILASHIIDGINDTTGDYFIWDSASGTLDKIKDATDIDVLFDFLDNRIVYDESLTRRTTRKNRRR